jgi:hypothetical protein
MAAIGLDAAPAATVRQHGSTGRKVAYAGDGCGLCAQHGAHSVRAGEHPADARVTPASESSSAARALTHRAVVERASIADE